jgi:hypothetical protein
MQANHPFAKRSLNVLDEWGRPGCAVCGRPPEAHPDWKSTLPKSPEEFLTAEDRAAFDEWAERNRLRKERIRMETGIGHVG